MKDKWALFDFCDTLVDFQTANAFVQYVRKKNPVFWSYCIVLVYKVLSKVRLWKFLNRIFPWSAIDKRFYLLQLHGFDISKLAEISFEYYKNVIKPHFINTVLEELLCKQKEGYKIAIVSGGYDCYLKHFCRDYNIDLLLCTRISYHRNRCCGTFDGKDCMSAEKVRRIREASINLNGSIAYSDSITDLPMLQLADKGVVISHNVAQQWAKQNNFQEVIW